MKAIDRRLLFHLVDIVWGEAHEDDSVPSTDWARRMIQKAIERRRGEKYSKQKLNLSGIGSKRHNLEWFISRIGERVYRGTVRCNCESCQEGTKKGILITDETHANYLFDIQNELGIQYRAACASGGEGKGVSVGKEEYIFPGEGNRA